MLSYTKSLTGSQSIARLHDKATASGLRVLLVDERGTSSTCPAGGTPVPKPKGRRFSCPTCGYTAHRDVVGATNIAARGGGSTTNQPLVVMHRRAGRHLPGAGLSRRDPRRVRHRLHRMERDEGSLARRGPPQQGESLAHTHGEDQPTKPNGANVA